MMTVLTKTWATLDPRYISQYISFFTKDARTATDRPAVRDTISLSLVRDEIQLG